MDSKIILDDNLIAKTCAALLSSVGKIINAWSMIFAFATLIMLSARFGDAKENVLLAFSLFAGFLQAYFAVRCAFDASIFTSFGSELHQYKKFDKVLIKWKLRKAVFISRSIEQRAEGALKILRQQIYSFCIQFVLLVVAVIAILWF